MTVLGQDTDNVLLEPRVCVESVSDYVAVNLNNCDNKLGQARSQNEHEKNVCADGVLFTEMKNDRCGEHR